MRDKGCSKNHLVETVYSIIKGTQLHTNKKVTTKLLEKEIGNKYKARYAVTRLIKEGKIKRLRTIGPNKIEYFYDVVNQHK